MREAFMKDITKFLECRRIALVGASRTRQHFSRAVLREFVAAGYDVVPVNRQAGEIEGRKCFARVAEIVPPVQAALLMTGTPEATDQALQECQQANIAKIWIYKAVNNGGDHAPTVEACRARHIAVVEGYCPLMFLPGAGFFHRAHGFLTKLAGNYPL